MRDLSPRVDCGGYRRGLVVPYEGTGLCLFLPPWDDTARKFIRYQPSVVNFPASRTTRHEFLLILKHTICGDLLQGSHGSWDEDWSHLRRGAMEGR